MAGSPLADALVPVARSAYRKNRWITSTARAFTNEDGMSVFNADSFDGVVSNHQYSYFIAAKIGDRFPHVSPVRIDKIFSAALGSMPVDILRYIDRSMERFDVVNVTEPATLPRDRAFFGRRLAPHPRLRTDPAST